MLKQFELNRKFIEQLIILIKKNDSLSIAKKLKEIHPADIADIIEELPEKHARFLFEIFENPKSADIIVELDDDVRELILNALSPKKMVKNLLDTVLKENI